jgi:cell division protein FtsI (penicillin-binding protein 3)
MSQEKVNIRKVVLLRVYVAFGLLLLFAVWISAAVIDLQWSERNRFDSLSKKQLIRKEKIEAVRGNIYAGDGNLLATSVPRYDLIFDPSAEGLTKENFEKGIDSLAMLLARKFPVRDAAGWTRFFREGRRQGLRYLPIVKDLDYEELRDMKTWPIIRLGRFKGGFQTDEKSKRMYFMGDLARRSIGLSREGNKSLVRYGLEGAFDSLLRGRNGTRLERRMYGGVWRPIEDKREQEPVNGLDIVTTLDVNLQDVAQNALLKALVQHNADHGCVLLMETATGQIKAIANLKRQSDGSYAEALNYAVDEYADPGSTFKLISTLALLDDGKARPEDSIDAQWGEATLFGRQMVDATPPHKRFLTLEECFIQSSNVGISKFVINGYGDQPGDFLDHVYRLKLDQKPAFDIRSSGRPQIKNPKKPDWYRTTLPWMSVGYETALSPLQIATVYNAVANNGKMVKPYLVKEIRRDGKVIEQRETEVMVEKICNENTLKALQKMMLGVVERGTAMNLRNENYSIAGKTGTNQLLDKGGYRKDKHKASFAGYFPANNPQYTCVVVIVEPRNGVYYGGAVAGPVFREIADRVYSTNYRLHPGLEPPIYVQTPDVKPGDRALTRKVLNDLGISSHTLPGAEAIWVKPRAKEHSVELVPAEPLGKGLPDTRGMGLRDALFILENAGYKVQVSGFGSVWQQQPEPGTALRPGATVRILMSSER